MKTAQILVFIALMFSFLYVDAKKVCIVKNRQDADVCVNITRNRALADYVIVISKERYRTDSFIWVITDRKDAELKVFYSNTPENTKVFISRNRTEIR